MSCGGWKMRTWDMPGVMIMALLTQVAASVCAAEPEAPAQRWASDPRQENKASHSTLTDSAVTLTLAARSVFDIPSVGFVTALSADGGGGALRGDLSGVRAVSFGMVSDGHLPEVASLWLHSATSGRTWMSHSVAVSDDPRAVVVNFIALTNRVAGGWGAPSEALDAQWQADLKDVEWLAVRIKQKGLDAQAYGIKDFKLTNLDGSTCVAMLSRVEKELWGRFGVLTTTAVPKDLAAADPDQDTMGTLSEIMAGTNPDDAKSVFAAQMSDESGIVITWPCVADGHYAIYRSSALSDDPLSALPDAEDLTPTVAEVAAGVMQYRDSGATGSGPYFYRVRKH